MSIENHLSALRDEHKRLDEAVARLEASPSADSLEIAELKKKKLALKDRIETVQTRH